MKLPAHHSPAGRADIGHVSTRASTIIRGLGLLTLADVHTAWNTCSYDT